MVAKTNSKKVETETRKFSLLSSVWGNIGVAIAIIIFGFGIGWYFGEQNAKSNYEGVIQDYKFQIIQIQLDHQVELREERDKWESNQKYDHTIDQFVKFMADFKEFQLKENGK